MWTRIIATLALATVAAVVASATRADAPPRMATVIDPPISEAEKKLDQPLDDVDLNDTLDGCVEKLRAASGANMIVRWPVLKAAKYPSDVRIRLRLHGLTLAQVLDHLLRAASTAEVSLSYAVDAGAVVISNYDDLPATVRVYDVRDLIAAALKPSPDGPGLRWDQAAEQIGQLVTSAIAPDSWREAGGSTGSISELNGRLVVGQSYLLQRDVAALLESLRHPTPGGIRFPTTRGAGTAPKR